MTDSLPFGRWLRSRRKALDLTQEVLAEQVGCAVTTISKIEVGVLRPSRQLADLLAAQLELAPAEREAFLKAARARLAVQGAAPDAERPSTRWPTSLLMPPTALIGRTHEVDSVCALLRRDDVRLLTLTGTGGVGKTRVALQVAAELHDQFTDGVSFAALASISDPALIVAAIAQSLGIKETGDQPLFERVQNYLRTKQMLLLLDNFEHVVAAAPSIAELLAVAPRLKVLVTSREVLHLSGEQEFPLPPLNLPDAIALFVARAQAATPDFQLSNANAATVAAICQRLDGLPLAIELAAARVKLFPPQALQSWLDNRLQFLTGGARDLPARQQTIRNTIDWSYHLLDEDEQTLFRRLGVFAGGCTLAAAAAVLSSETDRSELEILDGLASLVDKSLLRQEAGVGGEPRFVMLETIREYALERLAASGEVEAIRRRHAEYYLALAEKCLEDNRGDTEVALFDQFERDLDNLRAALDWSHAAEIELRLAAALVQFWVVRGYASEGWERLKAALARRSQVSAAVRARALSSVALFPAHIGGDLEWVAPFLEEGLALYRMLGDTEGIAWVLWALGAVAAYQGDYERATQLNEQSLALYQALNDTRGMSVPHFQLGQLALLQGDLERARVLLEQSLILSRQSTAPTWAIARRMTSLGEVVLAQGDAARASALFVESLRLCLDSRDKVDIPMALVGLAGVARLQGRLERAARLLGAAETLSDTSGAYRGLAGTGNFIVERTTAAVRAQLDEVTCAAAWVAGRAMTLEAAIEEALRDSQ